MNFGRLTTDMYRIATHEAKPSIGITKRATCAVCGRTASIGQFPIGTDTCITCKPMPKGWTRGGLV